MNKFEQPRPIESTLEQSEQDNEKELNEYYQQMQEELSNLMVGLAEQKAQPSDIRTAMKESLVLNTIFNDILKDSNNTLDTVAIDALQGEVDRRVRMLRLDPSKFDLHKFHEFVEKNKE